MRIGSLCTGYGGLDMAVERVLGGEMVWYSEFDKHPSTLLSARFPGVPNLGDLTKVDWASLPPIDILTGGYPCQPFSVAGKRLGEHDPRHLWPSIREAIRILRPRLTLLENVAGHRRLGFDRVLGDCAEDGLDVRWVSLRASDIGAPHQRERLFFTITSCGTAADSTSGRAGEAEPGLWPCFEGGGDQAVSDSCRADVGEHAGGSSPQEAQSNTGNGSEDHRGVRPSGDGRETPTDSEWVGRERGGSTSGQAEGPQPSADRLCSVVWGEYEPAIRRWEQLTRPAPAPTEPNKNGRPRLTAEFDEWMMGLPEGWITDIDIPYGAKIKLCGNGVVPQQAELALRQLLDKERRRRVVIPEGLSDQEELAYAFAHQRELLEAAIDELAGEID